MSERRVSFEHDGHRFDAVERRAPAGTAPRAEPWFAWSVTLDGAPALEFDGPYPYRDEDVRKRVLEWYAIQKR